MPPSPDARSARHCRGRMFRGQGKPSFPPQRPLPLAPLAAALLGLACAGGPKGGGGDTAPQADTGDAPPPHGLEGRVDCAAAPSVTWEGWAQGFFLTHCQGCHAGSTPDRRGAPVGVVFDDEVATLAQRERVWVRTLDVQDMPPAGGLTADDRALLAAYLSCTPTAGG